MEKDNQLRVRSFENNKIIIEIIDFQKWREENTDAQIKIGSFLKIEDGNYKSVVTMVHSFKMAEESMGEEVVVGEEYSGNFILETHPIGQLESKGGQVKFIRGLKNISIPPTSVGLLEEQELQGIFNSKNQPFVFSRHSSNNNINIVTDGDKFFSRHLAVVGSTGSGKSCTVAKIIQEANKSESEKLQNTHILIFDIHGEYKAAFENKTRYLSVEDNSLSLPYWLMNAEELEDFFIESNESNSHNQVSQFKKAVICNKKRHNPGLDVNYDSPVYFDLQEVLCYLDNKNRESYYVSEETEYYAVLEESLICSENEIIEEMWTPLDFLQITGNAKHPVLKTKVAKGTFYGEFDRFLSRFETKMLDNRLNFMQLSNQEFKTGDFYNIIKNILGYSSQENLDSNITIIDLSSLPFEVVSIVVSIISRFSFEYCYHKTKLTHKNDTPYLLVFEEAHKYIPKLSDIKYRNTRLAVERIAKEGRKYGISCMIVSQRPSEISPTVFSQCSNFVVMRLTNPEDQAYVERLLPDSFIGYIDSLSTLETKEALIVGDSVSTPCAVIINDADPLPKSEDINFLKKWRQDWINVDFEQVFANLIPRKIE